MRADDADTQSADDNEERKMKRTTALIAAAVLGLGIAGCSSTDSATTASESPTVAASSPAASTNSATPASENTLTSQDGKLVDTDKGATAVEGVGFEITIDPQAKTATFQFIDPSSGEAFQDYGVFDYNANTYLRHLASSAMGKTYNYTYDLAGGELISVSDDQGDDLSQSVKDSGRWEKAQADTAEQAQAIQDYFQARYGMTIEEAIAG